MLAGAFLAAFVTPLVIAAIRVGRRHIRSGFEAVVVMAITAAAPCATLVLDLASCLALVLLPVAVLPSSMILGVTASTGTTDAEAWAAAGGIIAVGFVLAWVAAWIVAAWGAFCGACMLNGLLGAGRRRMPG
jgi:hypothetical protein